MSRNFGLSSRSADGGIQPSGPRHSADTRAEPNVIPFPANYSSPPDTCGSSSDDPSFFHDAVVIGLVVVTGLWIGCLFGASVYLGKLMVAQLTDHAQPVEYVKRMKPD